MLGRTLSHYEILEKLGEGGMGVVYKARDTRLGRMVAIKVLPPEKVVDPERKRRFIQEARAASALNHPNIVTIHDIGSEDGTDFIVMEYIAGRTLDQVLPPRGMRLTDALNYAIPIADALARAHAAGIVHRDLKPGNILVAEDGTPKLLDFGLAKLVETVEAGELAETHAAKSGAPATEDGAILGTVAYMSPEQAEARAVDARSDIFSFGAVTYELLTGRKAFQGDSRLATLAAILREEPKPASELVPSLPREIERLIARCLRKDPSKRWQTMADVRTSLQELKADSDSGVLYRPSPSGSQHPRRRPMLLGVAVIAIVGVGLTEWFLRGTSRSSGDEMLRPVPLTTYPGAEDFPSLSPDGGDVAFAWNEDHPNNSDIYRKRIGAAGPPLRLTSDPARETSPAWSPNGNWIAFLRALRPGQAVMLIPPTGGPERKVAELAASTVQPSLAWSPDRKWLVALDRPPSAAAGLWLLSVETGERRRLTTVPEELGGDVGPALAPDGRTLAFRRGNRGGTSYELFLLSLDPNLNPVGEPRRVLLANEVIWAHAWTPDGELVYSSGTTGNESLWRAAVIGEARPRRLTDSAADMRLTISALSHRMVFVRQTREMDIYRVELGENGGEAHGATPLIASSRLDRYPRYSPDGTRISFASLRSGSWQLWVADSDGRNPVQLTSFEGGDLRNPVWTADGRQIRFESNVEGQFQTFIIGATGGKPQKVGTPNGRVERQEAFSPDGRVRYFRRGRTLVSSPVEGGEVREVFSLDGDITSLQVDRLGVYFVTKVSPTSPGEMTFYRFSNRSLTKVDGIEDPSQYGSSISPDGRYMIYTKMTSSGSDLMLVEGFK